MIAHKPERPFVRAPEMSFSDMKALKGVGAHFLVDAASVVALHLGANVDEAEQQKAIGKHGYFVSMLRSASRDMPELRGIADTLEDPESLEEIQSQLAAAKAKPTDKVTLYYNEQFLVEQTTWHDWWREFKAGIRGVPDGKEEDSGQTMVCFASGENVIPAATHPKITGLGDVGAISMGAPLIGFDKDAFASYGLQQSANGAVSEANASAYRAAITHLIETHSKKLGGTKVLYWYSHRIDPEFDLIRLLFEAAGESEEEMDEVIATDAMIPARMELSSLFTGERANLEGFQYFALTLSGAAGRVMVRDWITGQFGDLRDNIKRWFDDLAVVHREGRGLASRPKFMSVLAATVRDINDVPAPHVTTMWRVATQGLPIPKQLMALALARTKLDIITNSGIRATRLGLLKAYLIRKSEKGDTQLTAFLNPEHTSPAYQCGRLMAVFASLQRVALGDVGAGVVQRFYASASTTPALVFARLSRTSQFHLGKLEPGLAFWYESRIADIMSHIEDRIPTTLCLEDQSLFALGYYQQMAVDRAPKAKPATTVAAPSEADTDAE